jgi:NAD dependent epimerase/dehydratase family enzyme
MNHILITGGTGLLGKHLTAALLKKGYSVSHLSRKTGTDPNVKTYLWDVEHGVVDINCIRNVDVVVHLAGAGIADEKWTDARKKQLIESSDRGNELLTEDSPPATDFLGECCVKWEWAVDAGLGLDLRVVKFRTGVVLTTEGGALPQLAKPIRFNVGSPLGSGQQWVPWIHLQDAVGMYLMAVEDATMSGAYNMAAPFPVTNQHLTLAVAKQLKKHIWLPHVPAFALKLLLGEVASVVLGSTKVSTAKIEKAGYHFKYLVVEDALKEIYG